MTPVRGSVDSFTAGNTQNHAHDAPARGVFGVERVRHEHAAAAGLPIPLPQRASVCRLRAQRGCKHLRKHHHAVFRALALAYDDDAAVEVDILDAQGEAFGQPHAGAVQQSREQRFGVAFDRRQQPRDLVGRQHHGHPPSIGRAPDLVHPRKVASQHLAVQEQHGRQRLPMRGRRHLPLVREHLQPGPHLGHAHRARMPAAMPHDEAPDPVDVSLFRAQAVVHVPRPFLDGCQQTRRLQRRRLAGFVGSFMTVHASSIRRQRLVRIGVCAEGRCRVEQQTALLNSRPSRVITRYMA
jgi:hypothetical protein